MNRNRAIRHSVCYAAIAACLTFAPVLAGAQAARDPGLARLEAEIQRLSTISGGKVGESR